ncbi:MAG TPA: hypothetical protein VLZ54_13395 [Arenibacter sp.]|nr:hypothetical protein [Arenibacter sp.]
MKKHEHLIILCISIFLLGFAASGQERVITGVVKDMNGIPIPGANVVEIGGGRRYGNRF